MPRSLSTSVIDAEVIFMSFIDDKVIFDECY